jgi:hypothetical protein
MRKRYLPRSLAGSAAHLGWASRAAFTAASMSSAVPRAKVESFDSFAGLSVSSVPPLAGSTNAPLMKWPCVSAISTFVDSGAGAYSQALANSSAGDRPGPAAEVARSPRVRSWIVVIVLARLACDTFLSALSATRSTGCFRQRASKNPDEARGNWRNPRGCSNARFQWH